MTILPFSGGRTMERSEIRTFAMRALGAED
jgi:hypothetical protein